MGYQRKVLRDIATNEEVSPEEAAGRDDVVVTFEEVNPDTDDREAGQE